MVEWVTCLILLHLCVWVSGRVLECDEVVDFDRCWNAPTHEEDKKCMVCEVQGQNITDDETITFKDKKGNQLDFDLVVFRGGFITKLLLQPTNKVIADVQLSGTNTKEINAQFFGSAGSVLKVFTISENYELSVAGGAFHTCINLEFLRLSRNNLSSIPPEAFQGLNKLIRLELSSNNLKVLEPEWFQPLQSLETLVLSENEFEEIPKNVFRDLTNLRVLNLHGNKIEKISRVTFQSNVELEVVGLSLNQIKTIQVGTFQHLSKLARLNLRNNSCIDHEFENKNVREIAEALTPCYPTTCIVPMIPNGRVINVDDNSTQIPGDSFETLHSAKVVCHPNHYLIHEKEKQRKNMCLEQDWQDLEWPQCHSEYSNSPSRRFFE